MLLLGHTGITLGIAVLFTGAFTRRHSFFAEETQRLGHSSEIHSSKNSSTDNKTRWLSSLMSHMDIRVLLIGSLLPDIIDKPIGLFFFGDTFSSGRIIGHTLLFFILTLLPGLYLYHNRRKIYLLSLSFGTFTHLVFDQMWHDPRALFWPIYGAAFIKIDLATWMPNILHALMTDPEVYVPEVLGAVVLVWFTLVLVRKRKVLHLLKHGQM